MTADLAVTARDVAKYYRVAKNKDMTTSAAEAALKRLAHPLRRAEYSEFRALDEVSFDIPWGAAVGIVGRNGAGKSTLLKLLTRITAPTKGRMVMGGRVGSLLEVGTGFHPELTGRENVYLNGTILGMGKREIKNRFDEIVEFSGVERFLETQVKRYSSGMYVRLAFAVAAHLESEILAVDEVLAVGDAEFQAKCLQKMRDVTKDGRTVLFVSHQIATVEAFCTTAIFLDRGRLIPTDSVADALAHYTNSFTEPVAAEDSHRRSGSGEFRIAAVNPGKELYTPEEPKDIEIAIPAEPSWPGGYYVSAHVVAEDGNVVVQCDSRLMNFWLDAEKSVEARLTLKGPWLKPGRYTVDVFLCRAGIIDAWEGACSFQVLPILPYPNTASEDGTTLGQIFADFDYTQV